MPRMKALEFAWQSGGPRKDLDVVRNPGHPGCQILFGLHGDISDLRQINGSSSDIRGKRFKGEADEHVRQCLDADRIRRAYGGSQLRTANSNLESNKLESSQQSNTLKMASVMLSA